MATAQTTQSQRYLQTDLKTVRTRKKAIAMWLVAWEDVKLKPPPHNSRSLILKGGSASLQGRILSTFCLTSLLLVVSETAMVSKARRR